MFKEADVYPLKLVHFGPINILMPSNPYNYLKGYGNWEKEIVAEGCVIDRSSDILEMISKYQE